MSQTDETATDTTEGIQSSIVVRDSTGQYWIARGPGVDIPASYVQAKPGSPNEAIFQLEGTGASAETEKTLSRLRTVFGEQVTVTRLDPDTPARNLILPPEA